MDSIFGSQYFLAQNRHFSRERSLKLSAQFAFPELIAEAQDCD